MTYDLNNFVEWNKVKFCEMQKYAFYCTSFLHFTSDKSFICDSTKIHQPLYNYGVVLENTSIVRYLVLLIR